MGSKRNVTFWRQGSLHHLLLSACVGVVWLSAHSPRGPWWYVWTPLDNGENLLILTQTNVQCNQNEILGQNQESTYFIVSAPWPVVAFWIIHCLRSFFGGVERYIHLWYNKKSLGINWMLYLFSRVTVAVSACPQSSHCDVISPLTVTSSVISLWHQSSLCENLRQCPGFMLLYTEVFQVSVYYISLFCWVSCSFSVKTEHAHILWVGNDIPSIKPTGLHYTLNQKKKCLSSVTPGLTWKVSHTCQYWTIIEQGKTELLIDTISLKITYLKFIWRTALYDLPYWKAEGGD